MSMSSKFTVLSFAPDLHQGRGWGIQGARFLSSSSASQILKGIQEATWSEVELEEQELPIVRTVLKYLYRGNYTEQFLPVEIEPDEGEKDEPSPAGSLSPSSSSSFHKRFTSHEKQDIKKTKSKSKGRKTLSFKDQVPPEVPEPPDLAPLDFEDSWTLGAVSSKKKDRRPKVIETSPVLKRSTARGFLRPRESAFDTKQKNASEYPSLCDEGPAALIFNVKVFIAADFFDIPALKLLATSKFRDRAAQHWNSLEFSEAMSLLWNNTSSNDRIMKDIVVAFASKNIDTLLDRGGVCRGDG